MTQHDEIMMYKAALDWHLDHSVDEALNDEPHNRTKAPAPPPPMAKNTLVPAQKPGSAAIPPTSDGASLMDEHHDETSIYTMLKDIDTLDALRQAIADYNGLSIKKTAKNMVFADGNPESDVMVIGEAPGADEDRQGVPFIGASGQLLDRMLAAIDLDRTSKDIQSSVYISNLLNWRPPGNRTPTAEEIKLSTPFIKKHIELVKPKIILCLGGIPAQSLLGDKTTISKLRGKMHSCTISEAMTVDMIATYHPTYLLRTPAQKKRAWQDLLTLKNTLMP